VPYIFLLPAIFLNPWIWKVWEQNWVVAILLIPITAGYFAIWQGIVRRRFKLSLILVFSLAGLTFFTAGLDHRLLNPTPTEIWTINQRRSLYPAPLGRLFQNKAVLVLDKITGNIFTSLDPNLYFFASHPRERVGITEFSKITPWFLPVFLAGLYFWFRYFRKIFLFPFILSLLLAAVSDPASSYGPLAMFPFVSSLIAWGLYKLI
jgi:hypothetical protein